MDRFSSVEPPMPPSPQAGLCPPWPGVVVLSTSLASSGCSVRREGPVVSSLQSPGSLVLLLLPWDILDVLMGMMLYPSSSGNIPRENSLSLPSFGVLFPIVLLSPFSLLPEVWERMIL